MDESQEASMRGTALRGLLYTIVMVLQESLVVHMAIGVVRR
jgi:hypothetical protein